jgi:hypothetical protein
VLPLASGCNWFGGGSGSSKNVSTFKLKSGDCMVPPTQVKAELSKVKVVSCTTPHTQEVYAAAKFTGDNTGVNSPYPGDDSLKKFADGRCAQLYQGYVGVAYPDSSLFFTYLLPSPRSWQAGDRSVVCIVTTTGNRLTRSVKDSRL